MTFASISSKQAAQYAYMCNKLQHVANKMSAARKTLGDVANRNSDKSLVKCVHLIMSESLQCENEIHAQLGTLNCSNYNNTGNTKEKRYSINSVNGLESLCLFFEHVYLDSYKKLLKDKHLGDSLRSLMQHHLRMFMSSLMQLRLFNDVRKSAN